MSEQGIGGYNTLDMEHGSVDLRNSNMLHIKEDSPTMGMNISQSLGKLH